MRRLKSVGELKFPEASSCMRLYLLRYTEVTAPLQAFLDGQLQELIHEACGVEANAHAAEDGTGERLEASGGMLDLPHDAVGLAHVKPEFQATAQRLGPWDTLLSQYPIEFVHIPGECNCWKRLLSRWGTLTPDATEGPVPLRSTSVFALPGADYSLSTKGVIEGRQVDVMSGRSVEEIALGPARRARDGVYRVRFNGEPAVWIPPEAKHLRVRLMISAHMKQSGHRGPGATSKRLSAHCV